MADDEPPHSSSSAATATTSGGSASSPSPSPPPGPPPAPPPLPLAAVVTPLPPPFPPVSIATAIPLPQQQLLLQQYQLQLHQQQRVFSFHLSPGAVASVPPPAPISLPLKHSLPPLSSATPGGAAPLDRHSRDDCWSEGATFTLIQAWGDRYLELNRGNLKQKHWKDVADSVNRRADGSKAPKTDIQCKNRLDTLKKKYKLEKSKIVGGAPCKWTFFDRLDELIGPSKKPKKPMPVKLRPSPPLLSPSVILAKRSLEDADQPPQLLPLALPAPNYRPSSAVNHVSPNHVARVPTHVGSALNHIGSVTNYNINAPNQVGSTPNHTMNVVACHQVNQVRRNLNHVASAVDAVSKSKDSPPTADSCPNTETARPKRVKCNRPSVDHMEDIAQAITKFGEVYERLELTRQQTLAEIEKQRMAFTKELELQRLQFFMQTQVELATLRHRFKRDEKADYPM